MFPLSAENNRSNLSTQLIIPQHYCKCKQVFVGAKFVEHYETHCQKYKDWKIYILKTVKDEQKTTTNKLFSALTKLQ